MEELHFGSSALFTAEPPGREDSVLETKAQGLESPLPRPHDTPTPARQAEEATNQTSCFHPISPTPSRSSSSSGHRRRPLPPDRSSLASRPPPRPPLPRGGSRPRTRGASSGSSSTQILPLIIDPTIRASGTLLVPQVFVLDVRTCFGFIDLGRVTLSRKIVALELGVNS
jgi:hypothetical protein